MNKTPEARVAKDRKKPAVKQKPKRHVELGVDIQDVQRMIDKALRDLREQRMSDSNSSTSVSIRLEPAALGKGEAEPPTIVDLLNSIDNYLDGTHNGLGRIERAIDRIKGDNRDAELPGNAPKATDVEWRLRDILQRVAVAADRSHFLADRLDKLV